MAGTVDFNMVSELLHKTKEQVDKMAPIRIMVVGKTGVGKSTLINNLFREKLATTGIGKPVTQYVQRLSKEGVPMVLYDTRGLELDEDVREAIQAELKEMLTQNANYQGEKVHLVYYCVNAQTNRIEEAEISLIKELARYVPVILVLTQAMGTSANEFKHYMERLNLPIQGIYPVMAEPFPIYESVTIPRWGLEDLVTASFECIPEENRQAFTNVQQIDIAQKTKEARRWVKKYIYTTFGIGFVPIPFSDASLLVPMQVTMLAHITAIFGVAVDQATLTAALGAVGGTTGATFAGRYIVANLTKMLPGVGTVVGGVISGATAASLTTALGYSYIEMLALLAKGNKLEDTELAQILTQKVRSRLKQGKRVEENKEGALPLALKFKTKEQAPSSGRDTSSRSIKERAKEALNQVVWDKAEHLIEGRKPHAPKKKRGKTWVKAGKWLTKKVVTLGVKWWEQDKRS